MANVLEYGHKITEFELHSFYYVHFRTNALGKGVNPPQILPIMGEIVPLNFFYKDDFGIK